MTYLLMLLKLQWEGLMNLVEEELDILDNHMSLIFTQMFKTENVYVLDMPLDDRAGNAINIILK